MLNASRGRLRLAPSMRRRERPALVRCRLRGIWKAARARKRRTKHRSTNRRSAGRRGVPGWGGSVLKASPSVQPLESSSAGAPATRAWGAFFLGPLLCAVAIRNPITRQITCICHMYIFLHTTVVGRQLGANPPRGMMWHRSIKNFWGRGYGRKTEKD